MFPLTVTAVTKDEEGRRALRPVKPTTPKPTKPDYFPLSVARKPVGPAIYPGAAAAEDASKGLIVSDALHDMSFYTNVSESLPDAGRTVLNSVLFSQRHVVNEGPSVEEDIASINERTRLWRASRLQEVITNYEHTKEQTKLDKGIEERIKEREVAERERTLRRITRILNSLIPEVDKALAATEASVSDVLPPSRREILLKQWKEKDEAEERLLKDIRTAERRWLIDRQYQRNMEERYSLDLKHYFSLLEQKMEERLTFIKLCETFYEGKVLVGVTDDEREVRKRVEGLETKSRLDIMEQMYKLIPPPTEVSADNDEPNDFTGTPPAVEGVNEQLETVGEAEQVESEGVEELNPVEEP